MMSFQKLITLVALMVFASQVAMALPVQSAGDATEIGVASFGGAIANAPALDTANADTEARPGRGRRIRIGNSNGRGNNSGSRNGSGNNGGNNGGTNSGNSSGNNAGDNGGNNGNNGNGSSNGNNSGGSSSENTGNHSGSGNGSGNGNIGN
jgi:hypothetical protein